MTKQVFSNLQFEYEISNRRIPPRVSAQAKQWSHILRILPGFEEAEVLEFPGVDVVPWGVTEAVAGSHLPPVDVVKLVNSKLFSHSLDAAVAHTCVVDSEEQFLSAVEACPHRWVLKHPFGVSGRERMVGAIGGYTESALGWARKRFRQGEKLLFEPWIEEKTEYSFHFDIERDGEVRYVGFTKLVTDLSGVFRGNLVERVAEAPEQLIDGARRAALAVASEGYWGPLGVDSLSGQLGSEYVERPVVELNARYTFGRLTLELGRLVPEDEDYLWYHPSAKEDLSDAPPLERVQGVFRLPEFADPGGVSGTRVLVGRSVFEEFVD